MRRWIVVPFALLFLGCLPPENQGSGVDGSEADVRTPLGVSGTHDVASCTRFGKGRLVRGLGAKGYKGVALDDKTKARFDAVDAFMNDRIRPALSGIHSVWGSGVGLSCRDDAPIGGEVNLSSWRDVDQTIAAISSVLERENIGENISIQVDGIPVADVN